MQDVINRVYEFQPNGDDELTRMLSEQQLLQIRTQIFCNGIVYDAENNHNA